MRLSIYIIAMLFFAQFNFAQDKIITNKGDTLLVVIDEIKNPWTRYKDYHFLDGPYRYMHKFYINKIILSKNKINIDPDNIEPVIDSINRAQHDPLLGKGICIELLPGYAHLDKIGQKSKSDYVGASFRFQTKWYFGKKENARHGISMAWMKIGLFANNNSTNFTIAPLNPGYTGVYKIAPEKAIETAMNFGLALANNTETIAGFNIDPGIYYRQNGLSVGIVYSMMYGTKFSIISWGGSPSDYRKGFIHTYSFSIGYKF